MSEELPAFITRTFIFISILILFNSLRLNSGYSDHGNYVRNAASAGQIVDGLCEALGHGAYCLGTGKTLHQLIADVARLQIGEYKHVGMAGNLAAGSLERGKRGWQIAIPFCAFIQFSYGLYSVTAFRYASTSPFRTRSA